MHGPPVALPEGRRRPDPEVTERPQRRQYSAEYKQRILRLLDACSAPGEVGSLLRREGLYSSLVSTWRQQRNRAGQLGLEPQKRGRKPVPENPLAKKLAQVEREKRKLEQELKKAKLLLELKKKVSEILGISLDSTNESDPK